MPSTFFSVRRKSGFKSIGTCILLIHSHMHVFILFSVFVEWIIISIIYILFPSYQRHLLWQFQLIIPFWKKKSNPTLIVTTRQIMYNMDRIYIILNIHSVWVRLSKCKTELWLEWPKRENVWIKNEACNAFNEIDGSHM